MDFLRSSGIGDVVLYKVCTFRAGKWTFGIEKSLRYESVFLILIIRSENYKTKGGGGVYSCGGNPGIIDKA